MTFCAFREKAVPGGGAVGTWLAIFVNSRMNTKAAAKVAILFIELPDPREPSMRIQCADNQARTLFFSGFSQITLKPFLSGNRAKKCRTGVGTGPAS